MWEEVRGRSVVVYKSEVTVIMGACRRMGIDAWRLIDLISAAPASQFMALELLVNFPTEQCRKARVPGSMSAGRGSSGGFESTIKDLSKSVTRVFRFCYNQWNSDLSAGGSSKLAKKFSMGGFLHCGTPLQWMVTGCWWSGETWVIPNEASRGHIIHGTRRATRCWKSGARYRWVGTRRWKSGTGLTVWRQPLPSIHGASEPGGKTRLEVRPKEHWEGEDTKEAGQDRDTRLTEYGADTVKAGLDEKTRKPGKGREAELAGQSGDSEQAEQRQRWT
ncbi:unnamed protein product [Ranitomeya imitator]|uniref:Uncharacterized protein n=1 Tax=Ranitomeya imitator TaxID=111125 RepID=A0ABN9LDU6_9NEOB|nr:unnamed protein product [Ranitomeya imitator]